MRAKIPFNLSKFALRDPPRAFDSSIPDPYREKKGKPGSGGGDDLLREFGQGLSNSTDTPGGGAAQFNNEEWPSDSTILDDVDGDKIDGEPQRDNGEGTSTPYGLALMDGGEPTTDDSPLGQNATSGRMVDDNHLDRKTPYNGNSVPGVLKSLRPRMRSII